MGTTAHRVCVAALLLGVALGCDRTDEPLELVFEASASSDAAPERLLIWLKRDDPDRGRAVFFDAESIDLSDKAPGEPIRVALDPETGEPSAYVMVRAGLEALIDRKSFYRLVELGVHREGWFGLWSGGQFFPMLPSEQLEGRLQDARFVSIMS